MKLLLDAKTLANLIIDAKPKIEDLENNNYGLLEIFDPLKVLKK